MFPETKIASSYSSARTKTIGAVNEAFGTYCHDFIVQHCQNYRYSCGTDGSNDTGIQKANPVSIRTYNVNTSKLVTNHFYNMCLTERKHGATATSILQQLKIILTWTIYQNCISCR